jgi:type IV secretion system protein VirD4
MRLVSTYVKNTTPKYANPNDPFWEKGETALLEALLFYLYYEAPPEEQNLGMVMEMLGVAVVKEDAEEYECPLDILFKRLEARDPRHLAVIEYNTYKSGPAKTVASILMSLKVRMEKLNIPSISALTYHDELNLLELGQKKVALFAIIPDNNSTMNFLVGMLYTQLFQELSRMADKSPGRRLPQHVHFLLDEFANVAMPSEFDKVVATVRSREISLSIILQNVTQLKDNFQREWESILGNCDSFLYLGGNEEVTFKYISGMLGKETISVSSVSRSRGRSGSYSVSWQSIGRELMTPDEVRLMDNDYAIFFMRGERGVMDRKYNTFSHPRIKETALGGKKTYSHGNAPNAFDYASAPLLVSSDSDFVVLDELQTYELFYGQTEINLPDKQE